uniref:Patched family protein n=1 Tax=Romanomermis culicivorax TaxID=13658 RepID=A0A915K251_ROMCU
MEGMFRAHIELQGKLEEDPYDPNIESFVFKLYHRNVITWDDHVHLMLHWRRACAKFPQLDAMVVDRNSLNPYMDERLSVAPTTLQTMGIALLSMMVATGLMMPDVTGMFYITLSFLSVDVGVVGFLNLWRCDLDLTTMTGILMTIGFSVYYTARVCYGYQTTFSITEAKGQSRHPTRKLSETMGAVGWPVLQGGVGTVLGIAPLAIVPCYVTRTFFKTIVLVVCAGLFHGLMIMPIMMTSLDTNVTKSDRRKRRLMWKNAAQARQN